MYVHSVYVYCLYIDTQCMYTSINTQYMNKRMFRVYKCMYTKQCMYTKYKYTVNVPSVCLMCIHTQCMCIDL